MSGMCVFLSLARIRRRVAILGHLPHQHCVNRKGRLLCLPFSALGCLLIILIIDLLVLASLDAFANLLRRFVQLGHFVGVESLLDTSGAVRSMLAFKAAVQAVMSLATVA